jgi:hypothetical protein
VLGIRGVIARFGKIDPSSVGSGDTFAGDPAGPPFWDSQERP